MSEPDSRMEKWKGRYAILNAEWYTDSVPLPTKDQLSHNHHVTDRKGFLGILDYTRERYVWPVWLMGGLVAIATLWMLWNRPEDSTHTLWGLKVLFSAGAVCAVMYCLYPLRHCEKTGINLKEKRVYQKEERCEGNISLSDITGLYIMQVAPFALLPSEGDGAPDKIREITEKEMQESTDTIVDILSRKKGPTLSRHKKNLIRNANRSWDDLKYVLVARDRDGKGVVVTKESRDFEKHVRVAATIREMAGHLSDHIDVRYFDDSRTVDKKREFLQLSTWGVRKTRANWVGNIWLISFIALLGAWAWLTGQIDIDAGTSVFDAIIMLAPVAGVVPMALAVLLPDPEGKIAVYEKHDSSMSDEDRLNDNFHLVATIAFLVGFFGFYLVTFSIKELAFLFTVGAFLPVFLSVLAISAGRKAESAVDNIGWPYWISMFLAGLITTAGGVLASMVTGFLMRLEPGGGGGGTIVPVYTQIAIVGAAVSIMYASMKGLGIPQAATVAVMGIIIVLCQFIAIVMGVVGMSHLPDVAIGAFMCVNAAIGYRFLMEATR